MKFTFPLTALFLLFFHFHIFAQATKTPAGAKGATGAKGSTGKTAASCKLKCKAELVPDMDCFITFKGKKSPLIKAGKKYNVILDCGENSILAEFGSATTTTTKEKDKKAESLTKIVFIEDTLKKTIELEFMGKDKFLEYVRDNKVDMLELSLKKHPEFADNKKNDFDIHPVAVASEKGNHQALKILLDKGASANPPADWSWPPLHSTIINNKPECFALLLDKGANVNTKDQGGWTPLHFAVNLGRTDIVNKLLEKGADVNAKTNNGETPLRIALDKGKEGIAETLKAKGGVE